MADASRDGNFVTTLLGVSSADGKTPVPVYVDPTTHRLKVDSAAGSGTVTSFSFTNANGFTGVVTNAASTPDLTLSTSITGIIKGATGAMTAAVAGDVDQIVPSQTGNAGKYLTTNGTTTSWGSPAGAGTVTSVSVVTANGFAGTVATATSTPAITMETTVTGLLKGAGSVGTPGAISAATDGTDYLSPTTGLKLDQTTPQTIANGVPVFSALTASELVATDASKALQSLSTVTYPSLTEISYVKGVTSSIQTQLNAKGTGNVTGPASSVTNNIATYNGTTGKIIQDSGITASSASTVATINYPVAGGVIHFQANSEDIARMYLPVGTVANYLILESSTTGTAPQLTVGGSDTNIDLNLASQGTGVVRANNVQVADISSAQTLTNKYVQKRVSTTTSTATITPDKSTYDNYILTAQAVGLTIANPSTMAVGDVVAISVVGTAAQTISFGTNYIAMGQALPTTTTASKWMEITLKKIAATTIEILWANQQ